VKIKAGKQQQFIDFVSRQHNYYSVGVLNFAEDLAEATESFLDFKGASSSDDCFNKDLTASDLDVIQELVQEQYRMNKVMLEYAFNILREYWSFSDLIKNRHINNGESKVQ